MDGSCNGLQHYSALGRDEFGAASVNVLPNEIPADVYSIVLNVVVNKSTFATQQLIGVRAVTVVVEDCFGTSLVAVRVSLALLGQESVLCAGSIPNI